MATKILPTNDEVTYTRSRRARAVDGTWYTISADCRDWAGSHVLVVNGCKVATIWGKWDAYDYQMSVVGTRNRILCNTVSELMDRAEAVVAGGAL